MTMSIGIFAFPDMEMLDFAGPYEVFDSASRIGATSDGQEVFRLVVISESYDPVRVRGGAILQPQATIADELELACLIIPGGPGVDAVIEGGAVVTWIIEQAARVPIIASVCTGAFILAQTGLLGGLQATTHSRRSDDLRRRFPAVDVVSSHRWVDVGQFVTSAGVSAGIDMALHLVERLVSVDLATATARRIEIL